MTTCLIHELWVLVTKTQRNFLLKLDDQSLVYWLTQRLKEQHELSHEEAISARDYIQSKLPLIREIT